MRRRSQSGQKILPSDKIRCDHLNILRGGRGIQAFGASLIKQRLGLLLRQLLPLLLLQNRLDLVFDLVERLHVRILLVIHSDDVKSITAFHQVAHLPFGQRECGLLKFRHGAAFSHPSQRTTFLGEIFKLRSALYLFQQVFGAMLRIGCAFFIHLAVGSRQRRLNQDVALLHLFRRAVLVPMLIVISLQLIMADLNATLKLVEIHDRILDFPLLRNGVGVGVLVTLVKRFEFGVGGMKSFAQLVLLEDGIVKLDLGVLLDKLFANLRIADAGAA